MLAVAFLAFMIFRVRRRPVELMLTTSRPASAARRIAREAGSERRLPGAVCHLRHQCARGDFGISYRNQQEVFTLIAERFPATFELVDRRDRPVAGARNSAGGLCRDPARQLRRAAAAAIRFGAGRISASFALGILFILLFSVTCMQWLTAFGRGEVVH